MDDSGSWLALGAGLLVLTLFFSVTTLSLRHVSWVRLEEAFAAKGRPQRATALRTRALHLTAATAMLRMVCNLLLFVCMIEAFAGEEQEGSLGWAFALSVLILIVFAVAIPHAWSRYAGTMFLYHTEPVLMVLAWLTAPLGLTARLFDVVIRRLSGVSEEHNNSIETRQEELLNVVEEGKKEGVVDEEEREMIESVLDFRETTAGEIMTPRTDVVGISAEEELQEVVETITREGHSRYPVFEGSIDKVIGMLYAKDLLHDLKLSEQGATIRQRLRKPYFVPETRTLRDLLHDMQNHKVHLAVVLDEYGGTAGVVTIEDILEELVGEITDEYEGPQDEPIKQIDEVTVDVDARCHVDELNDRFELEIPEDEDYETIGGFAFARLGYIPTTGETFEYGNLRFIITDAEQRKITRLRVVKLTAESEESA